VRPRRLELPQDCSHSALNAARLPIPPLANVEDVIVNFIDELTLLEKNINGIKILETI